MCNRVHSEGFKSIPEKGYGWKIVRHNLNDEIMPFGIRRTVSFFKRESHLSFWIKWDHKLHCSLKCDGTNEVVYGEEEDYGFCFFLTRDEAEDALKSNLLFCDRCRIVKIEYAEPLGSFISEELDAVDRRFAMCKRWRVVD